MLSWREKWTINDDDDDDDYLPCTAVMTVNDLPMWPLLDISLQTYATTTVHCMVKAAYRDSRHRWIQRPQRFYQLDDIIFIWDQQTNISVNTHKLAVSGVTTSIKSLVNSNEKDGEIIGKSFPNLCNITVKLDIEQAVGQFVTFFFRQIFYVPTPAKQEKLTNCRTKAVDVMDNFFSRQT